jgi:glutathione S-transferase
VRKVVLTAQWLGLDYQRTDAGRPFGVVKTPEYLRMNPNALVPLVEDEGFVLWESNVIVRYLCAKHASGTIYPDALPQRFDAERWMDWQQTEFNPAGRNAFVQAIRTPQDQRQPALVAQSETETGLLLTLMDEHLARQPFMAGEQFTMADIPLVCEVHRWWNLPHAHSTSTQWPHVNRWLHGILDNTACQGVLDLPLS